MSCRQALHAAGRAVEAHRALAGEEAIAEPASAARATFPARCFMALPPLEIEWPQRVALAEAAAPNGDDRLPRPAAGGARAAVRADLRRVQIRHHRPSTSPTHFGTEGSPISLTTACASGATAIQLGVEAIRRGECRRRAGDRRRRFGDAGIAGPLLAAVRAVDPERPARAGRQAVLQEPRWLRAWPKAPARWCWKVYDHAERARREDPRRARRLRREGRFLPPHPLEPGRQADHRLHAQCARRRRRRRPKTSTTSTRTAPRRPRTTRWSISASRPCSASAPQHPDLVQQVDDRPHPDGGGRGRGGVHAAHARASAHSADHQSPVPDPAIPLDVVPNVARDAQGAPRHLQFVRLRRAERLPGHGAGSRRERRRALG